LDLTEDPEYSDLLERLNRARAQLELLADDDNESNGGGGRRRLDFILDIIDETLTVVQPK
jgi:hypothetical protein